MSVGEYFGNPWLPFDIPHLSSLSYLSHSAAHGTTFLTSDEIRATYGNDPWWGIQHLRRRERHPEFFVFLTYFDQPGALILARIVDWLDCGGQLPSRAGAEDESGAYAGLTSAMIDAFDHIFDNIKGFEEGQGGYFYNFLQHPARYVRLRQDVREWLERLRREGKRCFIATNSHSRYARTLLRHCLGPGWRSLFDLVVVNARKARFFYQVHPFFHLDASGRVEGEQASTLLGPPDLAGPDAPTPISVTPLLGSGPWSHQPTEEEEAVELIELFAQGNAAAVQALADTLRWSQRVRGERVRLEMDADGHVVAGAVMPPFRRSSEHTSAGEDEEEGGGAGGRRRTGSWQGSVITAGIMDATEEEDGASGGLSEVEAREAGAGLVTPSVPRPLSGRVFAARQHAQIAYVGDSLHGDVVAAQNAMGWMSVAVVEELESSFPSPVAREWTLHSQPDDGRDTTAEECALRWEEGPWGSFWSGGEEGRRSYFGDVMLKHSAYLVTDVAALSATV